MKRYIFVIALALVSLAVLQGVHAMPAGLAFAPKPPPGSSTSGGTPFFDCKSLFEAGATDNALVTGSGTGTVSQLPLVNQNLVNLDTYSNPNLPNGGFVPMLVDSLIIVLVMLSILGILYGFGMAFQINKLTTFVKSEYAESLANVVIILVVMLGGFGLFNTTSHFLSDIAAGATSGASLSQSSASASAACIPATTSSASIFEQTCDAYNRCLISSDLNSYAGVFSELFVLDALTSFQFKYLVRGSGFEIKPFSGVQTLKTTIWGEEAISFSLVEMGAMLIVMLFVIYFLFPLFFYAGIALRTLPWTRAAGGSLLALFIAFYIVFPALLFSFAQIGPDSSGVCSSVTTSSASSTSPTSLCNPSSFYGSVGGSIGNALKTAAGFVGNQFGGAMLGNVYEFTSEITYTALQFFGVVISFIISYDLLEFLGDFLGAPSLQSGRILSKVI